MTNEQNSLGDALFSKTQQKVLGLLLGKPDQSFFTNEIVRWAGLGKGTVQRELERLLAAGILLRTSKGNQNHYQANPQCPIYQELLGITRKTFGIADAIKLGLSPIAPQVRVAFIFGSIAKGSATAGSDIDVMLIGDELSYGAVMELLAPIEISLGRTINPTLYTPPDVVSKLNAGNNFLHRVLSQARIALWGEEYLAEFAPLLEARAP